MAEKSERQLDTIRLFADLDPEVISDVERHCRWREYAVNETILDRDSQGGDVFFVVRGSVLIVNYSFTGREIALARIGAGSYFGELAAIDGQPRSASVVALEPSLVAAVEPKLFNLLVEKHRELSMRLLRRLARIIRTCDDRIMDLSTLGAHQRVYLELLRLAQPDPDDDGALVVSPMPAQKEIASKASTTRETVTRAISQLVADGVAERSHKSLRFHDGARLERLATSLDPDWGEEGAR